MWRRVDLGFGLGTGRQINPKIVGRLISDYQEFLILFGVAGWINALVKLPQPKKISIYTGWVVVKPSTIQHLSCQTLKINNIFPEITRYC